MPFYVYVCNDCNAEFTELRKVDERDDKIDCQACGSKKTKRKVAVKSEFVLKGQGWAKDGYRNKVK